MIKIEHVVLPSPEQMDFVIEGMRNPMNSWINSDSKWGTEARAHGNKVFIVGDADIELMQKLSNAGKDHRKYMRMMPVYARITAPLYWWKEFDTYKVGTVANSCSTMHKIAERQLVLDDFSHEKLSEVEIEFTEDAINGLNWLIAKYNETKDKLYFDRIIQCLPSSYNQTRNVMLNYEVLANIYHSRRNHKLDEWLIFCDWIQTLPYSEIITGGKND